MASPLLRLMFNKLSMLPCMMTQSAPPKEKNKAMIIRVFNRSRSTQNANTADTNGAAVKRVEAFTAEVYRNASNIELKYTA